MSTKSDRILDGIVEKYDRLAQSRGWISPFSRPEFFAVSLMVTELSEILAKKGIIGKSELSDALKDAIKGTTKRDETMMLIEFLSEMSVIDDEDLA